MSLKLAQPVQFLRYLNRLHVVHKVSLEPERDDVCWKCLQPFQPEDKILPEKGGNGARRKARHIDCALQAGIITEKQYEHLKHFKNFVYVGLMSGWLMVLGQSYFLING